MELTKAEEKTLIWLAGWEESTVDHLVSVIEKVARKRAEDLV
ncbi:MAG: DNA ligase [Clostridia bacterium]|nr:DNA ligase [Clostridia bacterium]